MKYGVRKPSIKKSVRSRTTGRVVRKAKKTVNPLYGKKGMGYINNPSRAVYNKIYNRTTFSAFPRFDKANANKMCVQKRRNSVRISHGNILVGMGILLFCIGLLLFSLFTFRVMLMGAFLVILGIVFRATAYDNVEICDSTDTDNNSCSTEQIPQTGCNNSSSSINTSMKQYKPPTKLEAYAEFIRSKNSGQSTSGYLDNMNCRQYKFKAKYAETKRIRSRIVYVFGEETPEQTLKELGYMEPFTYERVAFDPATDAQKNLLIKLNLYSPYMCSLDATAVISGYENIVRDNKRKFQITDEELFKYAQKKRVCCSYYATGHYLKRAIYEQLNTYDKILDFALAVYCHINNLTECDPDLLSESDKLLLFADIFKDNSRFTDSLSRFDGIVDSTTTKTVAYKIAKEFLTSTV